MYGSGNMTDHNNGLNFNISRRGFLKISGATVASVAAAMAFERVAFLQSIDSVDNPLAFYPNRSWEAIYRDQFRSVYGSFIRTLEAMSDAREVGLSFQVNTTVSNHSVKDLPVIEALVASSGADVRDVFLLVPTGRAKTSDAISTDEHERLFHWLIQKSKSAPMQIKTTLAMHYRRVRRSRKSFKNLDRTCRRSLPTR
jgi:MoaA/NifB/PqqE/SkfB family radical SAM enzyme